MGGRGSKNPWNKERGGNTPFADTGYEEGTGNTGLDTLARNAGFSKVMTSQWYRQTDKSNRLSDAVLGSMMNAIGKIERKFHILEDYDTQLHIGRVGKGKLGAAKPGNKVIWLSPEQKTHNAIIDAKDNIRTKWHSASGSSKSALQSVTHTAVHEYGHAVAWDFKKKTGKDLASETLKRLRKSNSRQAKTFISEYGRSNRHEWAAEVFAQAFSKHGKQNAITAAMRSVLREMGGYKF